MAAQGKKVSTRLMGSSHVEAACPGEFPVSQKAQACLGAPAGSHELEMP